jgi:maltooligosyltrehalose trehalohydrolase
MADSAIHRLEPGDFSLLGRRRLPVGAEILDDRSVHVRVYAPAVQRVELVLVDRSDTRDLNAEPRGYFSAVVNASVGEKYLFRLDGSAKLYPDPVSRFQPEGPHGPSVIVDPSSFSWADDRWAGVSREGQVVYEMHVGTFTREGTWEAATRELAELRDVGITVIELMPIAEFEGRFGWGYDGVDLFAPSHLYGSPDDFRRFVDQAHAVGLGVILDVVYNHLGPVGNYLRAFSPSYFTDRYNNEWGDAINFDGDDAGPVRELFVANAGYWIDEFHLDGLRLDATQQIFDRSSRNVMIEIGQAVRRNAKGRATYIVAENEPQHTALVRGESQGGFGLDALWNDDFHHSAMVALHGRAEAYYSDTTGEPQEFISAAKYGYLYQGQYYHWQRNTRGTPALDLDPACFVGYLQNHDQVANSVRGLRGHQMTSPGRWRTMTALLLLMPATPMLFQGQEFSSSAPFLYFADFEEELAAAVRTGRAQFLKQFPSVRGFERMAPLDNPGDPQTFYRCKLDFRERVTHGDVYALHRDLLRLRRETPAFAVRRRGNADGAVLSQTAFMLRFFAVGNDDRVLLVNFGRDLNRPSIAEPLLAPPVDCEWRVQWSTDDPTYGGSGLADLWPEGRWCIPGESAIVLAPAYKQPAPVRRSDAALREARDVRTASPNPLAGRSDGS